MYQGTPGRPFKVSDDAMEEICQEHLRYSDERNIDCLFVSPRPVSLLDPVSDRFRHAPQIPRQLRGRPASLANEPYRFRSELRCVQSSWFCHVNSLRRTLVPIVWVSTKAVQLQTSRINTQEC